MAADPERSLKILEVDQAAIMRLKQEAGSAPLKRSRICLHSSEEDPIQEMIIAFAQGSYVRPHRHSGKSESFHLIDGDLDVVFFDDEGRILRRIQMSTASERTRIYRLNSMAWHTLLIRSPFAVIHEVTNGPFRRSDCAFAAWAPEPHDTGRIGEFLKRLESRASQQPITG
jgi:cupin fold WbuC family metalloprotein